MSSEDDQRPYYGECVSCGRRIFVDLLDEHGMCDYCHEIRREKGTIRAVSARRRRKKTKKNKNPGSL
jgi:hypothetical protein